jgi:hypothetical protein
VRTAHPPYPGSCAGPEQWLIYEWPKGEPEPTKFWLADFSKGTSQRNLVRLAKLRWRVERDYQGIIPDRLSRLGLGGSTEAGRGQNLPAAELVENGRLASPVGVFASMDDDDGEMFPFGVGLRPVELKCVGDAKGASGEHASDEAMVKWRLGACRGACLGNSEVVAMDDRDHDASDRYHCISA